MAILMTPSTRVLVQGITGKEGRKATAAMIAYGTHVVGGVRPGKAGEVVSGAPVYNSVSDAVSQLDALDVSVIYVPPFAAKDAIMEAIDAGISLINVIVERIPIRDVAYCLAAARERPVRILGPSSLGYIIPRVGRVGMIGGPIELANEIYTPGALGIISRSGGMTNEVAWQVRRAGYGQSTAVHIGGDLLLGMTYVDILRLFEQDDDTKAVIIFGEHGGSYEFAITDMIAQGEWTKPLAIYIGGKFASSLPEGTPVGHAGAIVERGKGAQEKEAVLSAVGVHIAEHPEQLVDCIAAAL
jgi:succinyl-CoA synthetase alpha subunit